MVANIDVRTENRIPISHHAYGMRDRLLTVTKRKFRFDHFKNFVAVISITRGGASKKAQGNVYMATSPASEVGPRIFFFSRTPPLKFYEAKLLYLYGFIHRPITLLHFGN